MRRKLFGEDDEAVDAEELDNAKESGENGMLTFCSTSTRMWVVDG